MQRPPEHSWRQVCLSNVSRQVWLCRRATVSLAFVPILMGSAYKNKGVQLLLDGVSDYLPSPGQIQNTALVQTSCLALHAIASSPCGKPCCEACGIYVEQLLIFIVDCIQASSTHRRQLPMNMFGELRQCCTTPAGTPATQTLIIFICHL